MIVLHVVSYFAPAWTFGGVCRAVTALAREQARTGHTPIVLTTDALTRSTRLPAGEATVDGVPVVRLRNLSVLARARFNLSTPIGLRRTLKKLVAERAVEVVHCHELRTTETLAAAGAARRGAPPLVLSPHGTLPHSTGRTRAKQIWDAVFTPRMLPAFDQVVALTDAEAADVRALWAHHRVPLEDSQVAVVANGVDPASFTARPARSAARGRWSLGDGPVVLFMGRLSARKGVTLLVDAFADVARTRPDARLLIAGPDEGMESTTRAAVRDLGISDRVVFAGALSGDDRLAALAAADLFALPAIGEGFSVAVLEALACGVPAILSPECQFPALAEAGAGIVVTRQRAQWAGAMSALLADPARLDGMSGRARALVERQYTWRRIAGEVEAAYRAAIDRRRVEPR